MRFSSNYHHHSSFHPLSYLIDVSKAPLPLSLRTRFTELCVSEPTTLEDLRLVADACLQGGGSSGGIYVLYVCLPSPYNLDAFRSLSYPAGLPSTLSLSLSLLSL